MDENVVNAINPNNGPNNKTNTFNLVIGIATLLIALLGATFAYFSASTRSRENDVTVKSAYVSISYDGGTEIIANNLIPSTETVALSKYMKDVDVYNPETDGELILDYDKYNSIDMIDRKCVDAKGKEVCYVYQFSIESDGVEGGETNILASIKVNKNEFTNLSYLIFEVDPLEEDGIILTDKYGFDIINKNSEVVPGGYNPVGNFDKIDTNPDNPDNILGDNLKFATFDKTQDIVDDTGNTDRTISPVACLFGEKPVEVVEGEPVPEEDVEDLNRCLSYKIKNNVRHTYQLLIWLEETGDIQDEQGMIFEGTVNIEVVGGNGGNGINPGEGYDDGQITGRQ